MSLQTLISKRIDEQLNKSNNEEETNIQSSPLKNQNEIDPYAWLKYSTITGLAALPGYLLHNFINKRKTTIPNIPSSSGRIAEAAGIRNNKRKVKN
jgi:hypothetical protein